MICARTHFPVGSAGRGPSVAPRPTVTPERKPAVPPSMIAFAHASAVMPSRRTAQA